VPRRVTCSDQYALLSVSLLEYRRTPLETEDEFVVPVIPINLEFRREFSLVSSLLEIDILLGSGPMHNCLLIRARCNSRVTKTAFFTCAP
jgi:hypothetical protein